MRPVARLILGILLLFAGAAAALQTDELGMAHISPATVRKLEDGRGPASPWLLEQPVCRFHTKLTNKASHKSH